MNQDQPLLNGRCQCGNLPIDCTCPKDKPMSAEDFRKQAIGEIRYNINGGVTNSQLISRFKLFFDQYVAIAVAETDVGTRLLINTLKADLANQKALTADYRKSVIDNGKSHNAAIAARDNEIANLKLATVPLYSRREMQKRLDEQDKEIEGLKADLQKETENKEYFANKYYELQGPAIKIDYSKNA